MATDTERRRMTLGKETLVPLGFVITIVIGVLWLNNQLMAIKYEMSALRVEMQAVKEQVEGGVTDRWRGDDMKHWANLLQAMNPDLNIPPPLSPKLRGID